MNITKIKGKDLEFISQINRNGKAVTDISGKDMSYLNEITLEILSLSLTHKTHIAWGFRVYVVKLKQS